MAWNVLFYETASGRKHVARFLKALSAQAHSKCVKYIGMLQEHGRMLPGQYLEKVRGELWALRPEYGGNEYRIIFFHAESSKKFVVVHAIHKTTTKIPEDDISTAEARMDDWNERQKIN
jgi:phage-related protein